MVVPADACVRFRDKFALIISEESGNYHKRDCFSQLFNLRTKSGEHNILCRWTDHTLNGDAVCVCVCMLNKRIISLCNRWFSVYTIHFFFVIWCVIHFVLFCLLSSFIYKSWSWIISLCYSVMQKCVYAVKCWDAQSHIADSDLVRYGDWNNGWLCVAVGMSHRRLQITLSAIVSI